MVAKLFVDLLKNEEPSSSTKNKRGLMKDHAFIIILLFLCFAFSDMYLLTLGYGQQNEDIYWS